MPNIRKSIKIHEVDVPLSISIERRASVRVSFGRENLSIRLPYQLSETEKNQHIERALLWANEKANKSPELLSKYRLVDFDKKDSVHIYGKELLLDIKYEDRETGKGDYHKRSNTIRLVIPLNLSGKAKDKMIRQLLSRLCAQLFQKDIEQRVYEINEKCFHKEIKSVKLKYNVSNWGSCSSSKNINLSTRLLFAPLDVIDYVIIHELSHLYEMNHSDKFWNIVSQVMPNYKEKEAWLTTNGAKCDF